MRSWTELIFKLHLHLPHQPPHHIYKYEAFCHRANKSFIGDVAIIAELFTFVIKIIIAWSLFTSSFLIFVHFLSIKSFKYFIFIQCSPLPPELTAQCWFGSWTGETPGFLIAVHIIIITFDIKLVRHLMVEQLEILLVEKLEIPKKQWLKYLKKSTFPQPKLFLACSCSWYSASTSKLERTTLWSNKCKFSRRCLAFFSQKDVSSIPVQCERSSVGWISLPGYNRGADVDAV